MRRATSLLECSNLVVQCLPLPAKNMSARDDDIDLFCAGFYGASNFRNPFRKRRKPGWKSGGNRGHTYTAPFQRVHSRFNECVIHADSADLQIQFFDTQLLYQFSLNRLTSLRT